MAVEDIKKTRKFVESARRLIKGKFVLRSDNKQAFEAIEDLQYQLNEYFSLIGAELIIDEVAGVARLMELEDMDYQVTFGLKKMLGPIESVICVYLRLRRHEHLTGKDVVTESVVVSEDDLWSFCKQFNKKRIEKKFRVDDFNPAINGLKEKQILSENSDGTYTITPVCDIVLNHDQIEGHLEAAKKFFAVNADAEARE